MRASFIQGSQGNDLFNGIFRYDLNTTNLPVSALERWTGEGSTNEHPAHHAHRRQPKQPRF